MRSIEFFVVFTVAALHFTVVPWGIGTDELVAEAKLFQFQLKERGLSEPFGKKRLVNSVPLSVWTHSMRYGNFFTTWRKKIVEE